MAFDLRRTFTSLLASPDAELQMCIGFFENSSVGWRTRAVSAEFPVKIGQKAGKGSVKKGVVILFPTKCLCILDAEFNVDYDFFIKHDLIL